MTKTSCIRYTPNTQLVLIRAELISIFKDAPDAACAAAIMNVFAYWTDIKLESTKQAKIENEIARREGKEPTQDESLWIYKSNGELTHTDLMSIWGEKKVGDCLRWLVECGLILSRRNPRFGYDRTLQYRLDTDAFQECIDNKVLPMPQNCAMEAAILRDGSRNIALTIPKTTSKITQRVSTPAIADANAGTRPTAKAKRSGTISFPVKGLTEKLVAGKTTKQAAPPKARNEIWELVLEHSFGIVYDPNHRPAKSITGRVDGCTADLKHHGIDAETLRAFYKDHSRWRPNTNVPAERGKLVSAVELWQKECRPKSNIITGDWTPLHQAYADATAAPASERGKILSLPTARIESFLLQEDELGNTALAPHKAILEALKGKAGQ